MLGNMVEYVKLVIATISIFNSVEIVSSQEHGLATECEYKCKKTLKIIVSKVFQAHNLTRFFDAV